MLVNVYLICSWALRGWYCEPSLIASVFLAVATPKGNYLMCWNPSLPGRALTDQHRCWEFDKLSQGSESIKKVRAKVSYLQKKTIFGQTLKLKNKKEKKGEVNLP